MIIFLLELIHRLLFIIPYILFFIPIKYTKTYIKYIILIILLTPLHWIFFDGHCILNLIKHYIKYNNFPKKHESPINENILYTHFIVSYIIIWLYIFYGNHLLCK